MAAIELAEKLPWASLRTNMLGTAELVAERASETPDATEAALTPPTEATVVELWFPVTSPESAPEKLVARLAAVAVPTKLEAVIALAEKFPAPSRITIRLAWLELAAEFAALAPEATEAADRPPTNPTTVEVWVPETSPASEPVKFAAEPAEVAVPTRFAVITLAAKLPLASRIAILLGRLALAAEFAEAAPEATEAADCPPTELTVVAPWVPVTSPDSKPVKEIEEFALVAFPTRAAVTTLASKFPSESLATILLGWRSLEASLAACAPEATDAALDPPTEETTVADCVPVTSPERGPENPTAALALVAFPLRLADTTLAEKFPRESLATMRFAKLAAVAEFAAVAPEATEVAATPPTAPTDVADCVPVTSPDRDPENPTATPFKLAVTTLAEKLPKASLDTSFPPEFVEVAEFAAVAPEATEADETPPTLDTTVDA